MWRRREGGHDGLSLGGDEGLEGGYGIPCFLLYSNIHCSMLRKGLEFDDNFRGTSE